MFQNVVQLRARQEEGIVFSCGMRHAKGLIDEFKKHGLQDEVLYYFPHSSDRYDESADDITLNMTASLESHTYLLSQVDMKPFEEKVLQDITAKTRYKSELNSNFHTQFLSERCNAHFRPFLRPGYHVDALVDVADVPDIEDIQRRVIAAGIQTHNISLDGRTYLVIPNVNTSAIADRIRRIS